MNRFFLLLVVVGGCKGLPADAYEWHPELDKTRGKLQEFVVDLPLGRMDGVSHHHPLNDDDDTITISNVSELSPFVNRPEKALASATAWYKRAEGPALSFVYAALLPTGQKPVMEKEASYTGRPSWTLGSPSIHFKTSSLAESQHCRLFQLDGSVNTVSSDVAEIMASVELDDALDYVVLSGARQNLYLEIALTAPKGSAVDWSQEPFQTLARAFVATRLDICDPTQLTATRRL